MHIWASHTHQCLQRPLTRPPHQDTTSLQQRPIWGRQHGQAWVATPTDVSTEKSCCCCVSPPGQHRNVVCLFPRGWECLVHTPPPHTLSCCSMRPTAMSYTPVYSMPVGSCFPRNALCVCVWCITGACFFVISCLSIRVHILLYPFLLTAPLIYLMLVFAASNSPSIMSVPLTGRSIGYI